MKNIVFMGSKPIGYSCLEFLIAKHNELDINIVGVFTNYRKEFSGDNDLAKLAQQYNISLYSTLDDILLLDDFDILISVQYNKILKRQHIIKAKEIAINLHMAPLPEYRGSNQFSFAIINGDQIFGTTIHKLDESTDGGAIIFEERFNIDPTVTVKELYDITFEKSIKLFTDNIFRIIKGDFVLIDQDSFQNNRRKSFHLRKEISEIKHIRLNWEEEKIDRYLRATSMPGFEPPFSIINGKRVYLVTEYMYEEKRKK